MSNTISIANQPLTSHALTVKHFALAAFKERLTTSGANGDIRTDFVFNSGSLDVDTILSVSVGHNKDGSVHNVITLSSVRTVVDGDGVLLETSPIKAGIYWDENTSYDDAQTTVDFVLSLVGAFGLLAADGAANLGLVQAVAREITRSALG